jgi:hypothetical protein
MGIEPTAQAWEAWVLPLYDARYSSILIRSPGDLQTALQRRHRAPRQWGAGSPGPRGGGPPRLVAAGHSWRQCAVQIDPLQNTGIVVEPPPVSGPL